MTADERSHLIDVALAAYSGHEWYWEPLGDKGYPQQVGELGSAILVAETYEEPQFPAVFADFIATFDPPTVLRLLGFHRAEDTAICSECGCTVESCVRSRIKCCPDCTHAAAALCPAVLAERDRLREALSKIAKGHRSRLTQDLVDTARAALAGVEAAPDMSYATAAHHCGDASNDYLRKKGGRR